MTSPRARLTPTRWRWVDVAAYLPLALVVGALSASVVLALTHSVDAGLGGARTATENLLLQVGFYAGDLALLVLIVRFRGAGLAELGWRSAPARWLVLAVPVAAGTLLVAAALGALVHLAVPGARSDQCPTVRSDFGSWLGIAIPAVAVAAPVVEETVFRGFVHRWLRGHLSVAPAVMLSALIFAASHRDLVSLLPLAGVGVVLALVYERSRSIWPGVVVHGLFNLFGIVTILTATSC